MEDSNKPIVNEKYSVEKFEDEILLYDETGANAVYLNDTAYVVWQLCKEELTIGEMITFLENQYPAQKEQIRPDVLNALDILLSNEVIEFNDAQ